MDNAIIKKCSCGREYTLEEFDGLELPSNGRETSMYEYRGKIHVHVYRNCTCHSTFCIITTCPIKSIG